jgi:hypothetical protein
VKCGLKTRGDKILEECESIHRYGDFDLTGTQIPDSVKTHTEHTTYRYEYQYDDQGNWTERTQWTTAEPDHTEFRSMLEKRTVMYY